MRKRLIIALLLSFFLIHLPLLFLVYSLDDLGLGRHSSEKHPEAVFVNLPKNLPLVDQPRPRQSQRPKEAPAQSTHDVAVKEETVAPSPQKQVEQHAEKPLSLKDALSVLKTEQEQKEKKDLLRFDSKSTTAQKQLKTRFFSAGGDFLPDYKMGSRTYVNALANPNIQYFVELKRRFQMTWNPRPVLQREWQLVKRGGKVSSVWGVSVNEAGHITGLILVTTSGSQGFDNEARRTIHDSSPFSRPPAYLLKEDRQIHMAWTFVVYL